MSAEFWIWKRYELRGYKIVLGMHADFIPELKAFVSCFVVQKVSTDRSCSIPLFFNENFIPLVEKFTSLLGNDQASNRCASVLRFLPPNIHWGLFPLPCPYPVPNIFKFHCNYAVVTPPRFYIESGKYGLEISTTSQVELHQNWIVNNTMCAVGI